MSSRGYGIVSGVFSGLEVDSLVQKLPSLEKSAGTRRLLDHDWAQELAKEARVLNIVREVLGPMARAVRGILFDKSPATNWTLGWHQDTKIAVLPYLEVPKGYVAASAKEGVSHVQPPERVLGECVAIRIHLDDCGIQSGPLQVIPGSHKNGIRNGPADFEIADTVTLTCSKGDVIWMRPLLFHASGKASSSSNRRVIHLEYAAVDLEPPLEWQWCI